MDQATDELCLACSFGICEPQSLIEFALALAAYLGMTL